MKVQAAVIAEDPVYLNWLQNAVPGVEFSVIRPVDAEDLMERLQSMGRVEMVFFQVDTLNVGSQTQLMERLLDRMPDLPLAAVGESQEPDTVLACMRAGARDFFVLRKDEANVAASLGRLLRRTAQVQQAVRGAPKGKLFTVLGAHPHESIAFTAEHLALACLQLLPKTERVLLLDVATPAGAAAIFLNVIQSYTVLDAINDVYRCDQTLVETAFSKHASGLYVLSLPEDFIGRPPLSTDEFLKLLQILRGLFSAVVVSIDGHTSMACLRGVISQSDRTLMLTDQSIIKSRHSKFLLRALRLEDCPLDTTCLVIDNYRKRVGLEPQNLAELLDLRLLVSFSADAGLRIQSMNSGDSLFTIAPKDPYCADMRRTAQALLAGDTQAVESQKTLLSKMFG